MGALGWNQTLFYKVIAGHYLKALAEKMQLLKTLIPYLVNEVVLISFSLMFLGLEMDSSVR